MMEDMTRRCFCASAAALAAGCASSHQAKKASEVRRPWAREKLRVWCAEGVRPQGVLDDRRVVESPDYDSAHAVCTGDVSAAAAALESGRHVWCATGSPEKCPNLTAVARERRLSLQFASTPYVPHRSGNVPTLEADFICCAYSAGLTASCRAR